MQESVKKCICCGNEKPLSDFWKDPRKIDGLRPKCITCLKMSNAAYYENNKNHVLQVRAKYLEANPNYNKDYFRLNKEKERIRCLAYARANKDKVKIWRNRYVSTHKKQIAESKRRHLKKRYLNDPEFRETFGLRRYVTFVIKAEILKRDDYKCVLCGINTKLQCHHIISVSENPALVAEETNLVTLCKNCHYYLAHPNHETTITDPIVQKQLQSYVEVLYG